MVSFGNESLYTGGSKDTHSRAVLRECWADGKLEGVYDFRNQQGIYVLYDVNFNIVHVGQAGAGTTRLLYRLRQHTRNQLADRWERFSWFGLRQMNDDGKLGPPVEDVNATVSDVLNHMEAILLAAAEPPLNRKGGSFGGDVEQYLQYRDREDLGPSLEEMIQELHSNRVGNSTGEEDVWPANLTSFLLRTAIHAL